MLEPRKSSAGPEKRKKYYLISTYLVFLDQPDEEVVPKIEIEKLNGEILSIAQKLQEEPNCEFFISASYNQKVKNKNLDSYDQSSAIIHIKQGKKGPIVKFVGHSRQNGIAPQLTEWSKAAIKQAINPNNKNSVKIEKPTFLSTNFDKFSQEIFGDRDKTSKLKGFSSGQEFKRHFDSQARKNIKSNLKLTYYRPHIVSGIANAIVLVALAVLFWPAAIVWGVVAGLALGYAVYKTKKERDAYDLSQAVLEDEIEIDYKDFNDDVADVVTLEKTAGNTQSDAGLKLRDPSHSRQSDISLRIVDDEKINDATGVNPYSYTKIFSKSPENSDSESDSEPQIFLKK